MLNPPFSLMETQIEYVVFKLWMPNVQRISFRVYFEITAVVFVLFGGHEKYPRILYILAV